MLSQAEIEECFNAEKHLQNLEKVYQRLGI